MTDPCPHSDAEHHAVNTCEELIHYPSEDYPCFCSGFDQALRGDVCGECGHARGRHVAVRVCRPANGDYCSCRTLIR